MKGLIHIYCGDGKGKTTAALGLGLRAAGAGNQVVLAQFLKTGQSSELTAIGKVPGFRVLPVQAPVKFVFLMTDAEKEECRSICTEHFEKAIGIDCDMLILDEICAAMTHGMVSQGRVIDFLQNKPEKLEVVLTGRDPADEICAMADYISEIKMIKHPYDQGVPARPGIEY